MSVMQRPKVLIVDDSEFILQLLETIFETEGFTTQLAATGSGALAGALADPPDVVLLDVRMPGVDGWDVLGELRQRDATAWVPVVMMSTEKPSVGWALALGRGAQAYVVKPFSVTELVRTVRDVLRAAPPSAVRSPASDASRPRPTLPGS